MECPISTDPCPGSTTAVSTHLFLTLVNALMQSKCLISSPSHYPIDHGPLIEDGDEFDFIVVGAGSAGSVLGHKLSENRAWNVLVLEAGGIPSSTSEIPSLMFSLQETEEDWGYKTEPSENFCKGMKNSKCNWMRGKVLGGCSTTNAMLYLRGLKRDYDQWKQKGWESETLENIFKINENLQVDKLKSLNHYGQVGNQPLNLLESKQPLIDIIKEAAQELGVPSVDVESDFGYWEALQTIENGIRANTGKVFLGKGKVRENLRVALHSHVEKIVVDASKTARGLIVNIKGKKVQIKARNEIILSAGAVNTPQILMLSGIGPSEHLSKLGIDVVQDLPVGRNLQDHVIFVGLYGKIDASAVREDNPLDEIYQYFMHRKGAVAGISITNLVGFINTKNKTDYPNMQFHHVLFPKKDPYLLPIIMKDFGIRDEIAEKFIAANQDSHTLMIIPTLVRPKSIGKIELASTNPYDHPKIYPNYYAEDEDVEAMIDAIKYTKQLFKTSSFNAHNPTLVNLNIQGCSGLKYASEKYWKCAIKYLSTTLYHPVGTAAMRFETEGGVVDNKLKVYGINNLRIADASIMPIIPSVNTNAPCLMIGQKAARIIMKDWAYHDEF